MHDVHPGGQVEARRDARLGLGTLLLSPSSMPNRAGHHHPAAKTHAKHPTGAAKAPAAHGGKPQVDGKKPAPQPFKSGFDPHHGHPDSAAQYQYNLRGLTDDALDRRQQWLERRIKDAGTGPTADQAYVERNQEQLKLVKAEQAARKKPASGEAGKDRGLDNEALSDRVAKLTRLRDAQAAVDPAAAKATQKKLDAAQAEQAARAAEEAKGTQLTRRPAATALLTPDQKKDLKVGARTQSAEKLKARLEELRATNTDATRGAFQNENQGKNARSEIRAIRAELKARQEISKGPDAKFAAKIHREKDDAKLTDARAKWEQVATAAAGVDPQTAKLAKQHVASIDAELKRRGVGSTPPASPPPEAPEAPATGPESSEPVVTGDPGVEEPLPETDEDLPVDDGTLDLPEDDGGILPDEGLDQASY